jgi:hypothetical protein
MSLTIVKQEVATLVSSVVPTHPYLPERFNPNVAFVTPGSPYLQSGLTYGKFLAKFNIDVVIAPQSNEEATKALDEIVNDIVTLLLSEGYGINQVGQPYPLESQNTTFLAITIEIETLVSL